ncbi:hypothetical protein Cni_G05564 [Canna indica]|uniref:Uncharacterized protein n=1 Tax=Canna indica TaxID=4628 RepID=A0AAQ3JVH5_9LILI|nr:hypothetical protein Cni_G05564 [Canna indica]
MEEDSSSSATPDPFAFSNPCSFMLYIVRACAQCLGCQPSSSSSTCATDPDQDQEPGDDGDNGGAVDDSSTDVDGSGVLLNLARRPRPPAASEGRGRQIN